MSMDSRTNILIVITDQLSAQALPAYGDTYAHTPNIDRIVRRGVRFDNCYTNCPLCQPGYEHHAGPAAPMVD